MTDPRTPHPANSNDPVEMAAAEAAARPAGLFEAPPLAEQERMVEAILFATAEPVTIAELQARMPHGAEAKLALELLSRRYEGRGVRLVRVGEAWALRRRVEAWCRGVGVGGVLRVVGVAWGAPLP